MEDRVYGPAEVCESYGISKSTLFRWEKEGRITAPDRDLSGQRQYGQKHMSEIGKLLYRRLYDQVVRAEGQPGAEERLNGLQERMALAKFMYVGDIVGLYELAERESLEDSTIKELLREAARRNPADNAFRLIVKEIICPKVSAPDS